MRVSAVVLASTNWAGVVQRSRFLCLSGVPGVTHGGAANLSEWMTWRFDGTVVL